MDKQKDTIFGVPLEEYVRVREEALSEDPKKEESASIEENIEKIRKEQGSVEGGIQKTLTEIVKKFRSLGIDLFTCTKLDIDGADVRKHVESLKELCATKESNARAILRLKASKISQKVLDILSVVDKTRKCLEEWTEKMQGSVEEIEKNIQERSTFSEVCTGEYVIKKYEKFTEDVFPLVSLLHQAQIITKRHKEIYTEKSKEEIALSETFIKLTSQEEKALHQLLSLLI